MLYALRGMWAAAALTCLLYFSSVFAVATLYDAPARCPRRFLRDVLRVVLRHMLPIMILNGLLLATGTTRW